MCKKCTRPCTQDAQDCDCRQDAQYFAQSAQEYAWMHNLQHFVKCGDISFFRRAHNVSTSQVHRQLNCFAHILARNSIKPTKDGLHALHSERKRRKPCTSLTAAQPPLNQGLNQGGSHTMHIAQGRIQVRQLGSVHHKMRCDIGTLLFSNQMQGSINPCL